MTHVYEINGMTCGSCVARVKNALLKIGDITSAEVRLQPPQARITMSKHINTAVLQEAIHNAGNYTISETNERVTELEEASPAAGVEERSYLPLFLLFGYITGTTLLVQAIQGSLEWMQWMSHFMAVFFLVFSFFKLINLKGFAEGYGSYDIVAKRFPVWGYIYPFIELGLGIAILAGLQPAGTNIAVFLVMGVSSAGVIQSLLKKTTFQCACLGTVIKLPLSKVTLAEDLLMVVMSAIMISASL